MLILSRKIGESLVIGEEIVVTLLEQRGGQVRIGIEAPRTVKVYRQEIYAQIQKENLSAANSASASAGQDLIKQVSEYYQKLDPTKKKED